MNLLKPDLDMFVGLIIGVWVVPWIIKAMNT